MTTNGLKTWLRDHGLCCIFVVSMLLCFVEAWYYLDPESAIPKAFQDSIGGGYNGFKIFLQTENQDTFRGIIWGMLGLGFGVLALKSENKF